LAAWCERAFDIFNVISFGLCFSHISAPAHKILSHFDLLCMLKLNGKWEKGASMARLLVARPTFGAVAPGHPPSSPPIVGPVYSSFKGTSKREASKAIKFKRWESQSQARSFPRGWQATTTSLAPLLAKGGGFRERSKMGCKPTTTISSTLPMLQTRSELRQTL